MSADSLDYITARGPRAGSSGGWGGGGGAVGSVCSTTLLSIFEVFSPVAEGTMSARMPRAAPQRVFALQACRICACVLQLLVC